MKKFVLMSIVAVCSFALMAANLQKVYTARDEIYIRVDTLCRSAGVVGPGRVSPVNETMLIQALERIDVSELNSAEQEEYSRLVDILSEDDLIISSGFFSFDLNLAANLSVNIADYNEFNFSNSNDLGPSTDRREDAIVPYRYEKPFLSFMPELTFGDSVSFSADFFVKNAKDRMYESSLGWLITSGSDGSPRILKSMAVELPYQAGLSAGNGWFSLMLGRYPHSIGAGVTGNLVVGDNFIYQELAKLSFFSDLFSYDISVTRFDRQRENDKGTTSFSKQEFSGPQQYRVVHRFDVNLFDRFRIALNLGTIYDGTIFDPRFFYPFVLGHNYFNYSNKIEKEYYDEANNMISLDIEFSLFERFTVYAEVAIDQFQMYWEPQADLPPAFAGLINLKYSKVTSSGTWNAYGEAVYTNPYIYLNRKVLDGKIDYNLDYVVGYYMQYIDDYGYSGYVYGPDTMVFALGLDFESSDQAWNLGFSILYRLKGEKGLKHTVNSDYTEIDMSDAVIEDSSEIFMHSFTPTGGWKKAEHFLKPEIHCSVNFEYGFSVYIQLGSILYFNYDRTSTNRFIPVMSIGLGWEL